MGQGDSSLMATKQDPPPCSAVDLRVHQPSAENVEEEVNFGVEEDRVDSRNVESRIIHGDEPAASGGDVAQSIKSPEALLQQKDALNSTFNSDSSFNEEQPKIDVTPPEEAASKKKLFFFLLILIVFIVILVTVAVLVATLGADKENTTSFLANSQATSPSPSPSEFQSSASATVTPATETSATETPSADPSMSGLSTTASPVDAPTNLPSSTPTNAPTNLPSSTPTKIPLSYVPGKLTVSSEGLLLSEGLSTRIIARTGEPVLYHNGSSSSLKFHGQPDFGATFVDSRPFNMGGWVYTSNSEMHSEGTGGVGAITFDSSGNVIDYGMVLEGTTMNCGGGRTPWNTWVSCEEVEFFGEIYQVDPFGVIKPEKATIGSQRGRWESFAYDVRDSAMPTYFATEDHNKGTVRRFRPELSLVDWDNPWNMLHVNGTIDYLLVHPYENRTGGEFEWTNNFEAAKNNARSYYPQTEGIDVYDGVMYVVCKRIKQLFIFDLDSMTYTNQTTVSGLFDGGPDQMQRILGNNPGDLLYFTEEGGARNGIHARDNLGRFYTVFESPVYRDETTGLAFSPDGMHMYVAYQDNGLLFDVWRDDGRPFGAKTLNVKYHQTD